MLVNAGQPGRDHTVKAQAAEVLPSAMCLLLLLRRERSRAWLRALQGGVARRWGGRQLVRSCRGQQAAAVSGQLLRSCHGYKAAAST